MLPIKRESYFYDVYPRVVLTERETKITIRPIDAHAAFSPDAFYTIRVIPLTADIYSRSKPAFYETQVSPKNGAIEFYCAFCGEQEHSIRIFKDGIRELSFRPSASPNWLAMTLAIVLPVEVKDVGRILVLPISIVTAIVSPNALPKARI